MEYIEEFGDERQKSWCIYCAQPLEGLETNKDHVPSQGLLAKPHPHNLPVIIVCKQCNTSFSLDEQYMVTFLSCVLAGSTDPMQQSNASAARALGNSNALREQIGQSRTEYSTLGGETKINWKPELSRIKRVVLKNARGHAFFECGEPIFDDPVSVSAIPLESMSLMERQNFEGLNDNASRAFWPEVGSRMMMRIATGEDMAGNWVVVQEGVYRYLVQQEGGLRVLSVWSEYLATEVRWEL